MGFNATTYAASKKYTDDTAEQFGGLKGANCKVKSIVHQNGRSIVTFEWKNDSNETRESTMTVQDGTPIYEWQSGDSYVYGDLVIYASAFYRCTTPNSDVTFDPEKWAEIGSADGNYDIVTSATQLPPIFTAADRKMYYVIQEECFYLWNGLAWVAQREVTQFSTMPTASANYLGRIVQYIGTTTVVAPIYTKYFFYECVVENNVYSWEQVDVQANSTSEFVGTLQEWTDLPLAEKAEYEIVNITDDINNSATVVDVVADGNMNPVTSNAVYDAIQGADASLEVAVTGNTTVGAITSGTTLPQGTTFTEFVQKLLIAEVAPTISFSISKNGNVAYGTSYTETLTVNVSNMGSSKKIKTIAWYEGSTLLQTDTIDSTTTGSWAYTMSTATTDTTTFKAIITYTKSDDVDATATKTSTITFYYNKYEGVVADLDPTEATVTALTSALATAKGGTYSFTASNQRICYAYPKSLGTLTSIKDGNGFSLFDSFTRTEQSYTVAGSSVAYYRYVLTDATTVSGYSVTFA